MSSPQTLYQFRRLTDSEGPPLELLLLADPDEAVVREYLPTCELYVLAAAADQRVERAYVPYKLLPLP